MTKNDFMKMIAKIGPVDLLVSDGKTETMYPKDRDPADVYDAAQQVPDASILAVSDDLIQICCADERTAAKVKTYIQYSFDAGTFELANGNMIYRVSTAPFDPDFSKDLREFSGFLNSTFGGVVVSSAKDIPIDITSGPAKAGQRGPGEISDGEMFEVVKAFKGSIAEPVRAAGWNNYDVGGFRIDRWAESKGITVVDKDEDDKRIRVHTPYGIIVQSKKTNGCALVTMTSTAKIRTWAELTTQYDPERKNIAKIEMAAKEANRDRTAYLPPAKEKPKKKWQCMKDIRRETRGRHERYLQTDVRDLDLAYNGIKCGALFVLGGYTGQGKSTLLTQMALSMISHGHNVAIYSGELDKRDYMKWVYAQAAGPDRRIRTAYGYDISEDTADRIDAFIDERLFIFNHNDFKSDIDSLIEASKEIVEECKIDCFIFDNLMTMQPLDARESNENYRQQKVCLELQRLAKTYQCAVILVAHPRKVKDHYFMNPYDILGTSSISNLADTIMNVYRCNRDFDRAYRLEMGMDRSNPEDPLHGADGCYAVIKGRFDNKIVNPEQGRLRPLYYEPASSRLLSYPGQVLRFDLDAIPEEQLVAIREFVGPADVSTAEDSYQPSAADIAEMQAREAAYGHGNNVSAPTEAERKAEQARLDRAHKLAESQARQKEMTLRERIGI